MAFIKGGTALTDNEKLAELLFPGIILTPQQYEEQYPARQLPEGARVTRFSPSPTGYLHIGGLFAAMTARLTAKVTNGVFFLRIEDTDKKREVEGGVTAIVNGLDAFGITPDEGITGVDTESGAYGPYQQSKRREIYQCFAKELVRQGLAYPCFCTEEELNALREQQEAKAVNKGYYGEWAACRKLSFEEQKRAVESGKPYTLRLRSPGDESRRIMIDDLIKGKIEMPENTQDIVLLKTDGIPTYHFAHAVDDHLMRTTHVVRGDEWIASLPVHIQLFKCCGFKPPKYAHFAPIMKEENGGKRKLSKRKDPEAAVSYYIEQGYPKESVIEYLLTLANSNFEDWRRANKAAPQADFPFNLKKMSASGALFDLQKLNDVSKNVISLMTADEVYGSAVNWAQQYDEALYRLLVADKAFAKGIFCLDRGIAKPRKDLAKWSEVKSFVAYFYDGLYQPDYTLPENLTAAAAAEILRAYLAVYDHADDKDTWFARIKALCAPLGYTPNVKEYKKDPQAFKGHVGDVSAVIRIAVTSRRNTPDLHAIMQLLGGEKVISRMRAALKFYEEA
ncbi:MAG: glutamate--tRNA ligase [Clostridiales bacterium]|nr:glutamate--tRNA ligase [Clostridiales bacterium]